MLVVFSFPSTGELKVHSRQTGGHSFPNSWAAGRERTFCGVTEDRVLQAWRIRRAEVGGRNACVHVLYLDKVLERPSHPLIIMLLGSWHWKGQQKKWT